MHKNSKIKAAVFYSCVVDTHYSREMMILEHALIRILSGEMKIMHTAGTSIFRVGDTALIPRNQLGRIIKSPLGNQPFKSVSMYLTRDLLQRYYTTHHLSRTVSTEPKIRILEKHPLLDSLFDSLLPYFTLSDELPADISAVKTEEAISVLRSIDKSVDGLLGHFEEPGKIDLVDFMEKNYMFNMTAERFAYLTGRSLTTFKRDFKKAFNNTPEKWLTDKRLALAHYQILEKQRKPSDVYAEAGFENLSHFSFAFKKKYGLSPNQLKGAQTGI